MIFLIFLALIIFLNNILKDPRKIKPESIEKPIIYETNKWFENNQEMIIKSYVFYGLNGLNYYQKQLEKEKIKSNTDQNPNLIDIYQNRIQNQKEPTELLPVVYGPFKNWEEGETYFGSFLQEHSSSSLEPLSFCSYIDNFKVLENLYQITFYYKGPKKFLEIDKDYYIGDANLPYDPQKKLSQRKQYHLHFNPVRNTLSVYTEKFNTK